MTQVNFQLPPQTASRGTYYPSRVEALQATQLQFNLQTPAKVNNLASKLEKPRPIVIEKLSTQPSKINTVAETYDNGPLGPLTNLSSERLSLAIKLAKMDIRQLKRMSSTPSNPLLQLHQTEVQNFEQKHNRQPIKAAKQSDKETAALAPVKTEFSKKKVPSRALKGSDQFTGKTLIKKSENNAKSTSLFYPEKARRDEDIKEHNTEVTEIRRLRRELQNYMKRLDTIVSYGETIGHGKKVKPSKKQLDDDDDIVRQQTRAEEQASRSARMLYVLQRKVQEIQDELDRQTGVTKHTKKSQTVNRLAAAHRSAVRALQMFVKNAPLHYDVHQRLPTSYLELGRLIKQLSLLSSQMNIETDLPSLDFDFSSKIQHSLPVNTHNKPLKLGHTKQKTSKPRDPSRVGIHAKAKTAVMTNTVKQETLDKYADWFAKRAEELKLPQSQDEVPTPDRESTLRAGFDALRRARNTEALVVEPSTAAKRYPRGTSVGQQRKGKSILYTADLKKNGIRRKRLEQKRPVVNMALKSHFADATVSSLLKVQEFKPYLPKKGVNFQERSIEENIIDRSPGTPRKRDTDILRLANALNPEKRPSDNPGNSKIVEREVRRQAWLDKEKEAELRKIHEIQKQKEEELEIQRNLISRSDLAVEQVEGKIKEKLKPLLDKAEEIAEEERRREDEYKTSLKKRLAQIASDTVLSQAEILSEHILEDLLLETVAELQRIEEEEEIDTDIAYGKNKIVAETFLERLNRYEREENAIREKWTRLEYGELFNHTKKDLYQTKERKDMTTCKADVRLRQSAPVTDVTLPMETTTSIFQGVKNYKVYLESSKLTRLSEKSFERFSEEVLDSILCEVGAEVEGICNSYVDELYQQEFVKDDSLVSRS